MSTKPKRGRPKATDKPDVVSLLVSAFRDGMTVRQACIQSGISHEAYYQRKRSDEVFADKMYYAQQSPTIAAKRTVIKAIEAGDVKASQWWLDKVRFNDERDQEPAIEEDIATGAERAAEVYKNIRAHLQMEDDFLKEYPYGIGYNGR